MVNFCAVCGCCTRTDIVREHLEDTLRICDVSAKGLYIESTIDNLNPVPDTGGGGGGVQNSLKN